MFSVELFIKNINEGISKIRFERMQNNKTPSNIDTEYVPKFSLSSL